MVRASGTASSIDDKSLISGVDLLTMGVDEPSRYDIECPVTSHITVSCITHIDEDLDMQIRDPLRSRGLSVLK